MHYIDLDSITKKCMYLCFIIVNMEFNDDKSLYSMSEIDHVATNKLAVFHADKITISLFYSSDDIIMIFN